MKPLRFMIFTCEEQMMFCGQQALSVAFHTLFSREKPEKPWPSDGRDGAPGDVLEHLRASECSLMVSLGLAF